MSDMWRDRVPRSSSEVREWAVTFEFWDSQLSSVQDGIYALGKAHMRSKPSLRSFPKVAFETVWNGIFNVRVSSTRSYLSSNLSVCFFPAEWSSCLFWSCSFNRFDCLDTAGITVAMDCISADTASSLASRDTPSSWIKSAVEGPGLSCTLLIINN